MIGFGFSDTKHGLLVIRQCPSTGCVLVAESSSDAGRHWKVRGELPRVGGPGQVLVLSRLSAVVTIERGNGRSLGYRTGDGGRTWQRMSMPANLRQISVAGDHVWGATNSCTGTQDSRCSVTVWSAPVSGDRFTQVARPATHDQPVIAPVTLDATNLYLEVGPAVVAAPDQLLVSNDAGRTWTPMPSPCPDMRANLAGVQGSRSMLWALCAGQPSAGQMRKALFVSRDGGITWIREPRPSSGGYATTLTATSPSTAWQYGNGRADVFRTTNTGRIWHDVLQGKVGESAGGGEYWFDPLNGNQAWVINTRPGHLSQGLLRITSNGGRSWRTVVLTL